MKHGLFRDICITAINTFAGAALVLGGVFFVQVAEAARLGIPMGSEYTLNVVPHPEPGESPEPQIGEAVASQVDPITGATRMVVLP